LGDGKRASIHRRGDRSAQRRIAERTGSGVECEIANRAGGEGAIRDGAGRLLAREPACDGPSGLE
jgi:hypothetical protein